MPSSQTTIKQFFIKNLLWILAFVITVLLSIQYYFSHDMVLELTRERFANLAKQISLLIDERDKQAKEIVSLLGSIPAIHTIESDQKAHDLLKLFSNPMRKNNTIYAIYIGYPSGSFFEVINARHSDTVAPMLGAPAGTRWVAEQVIPVNGVGHRLAEYYDAHFTYLSRLEEPTLYDPRKRPWYTMALSQKGTVVSTPPYRYYLLKQMGVTYSLALEDGTVIALDITLEGLNTLLADLKGTSSIEIAMLEHETLIATSEPDARFIPEHDTLQTLKKSPGKILSLTKGGIDYLSMAIPAHPQKDDHMWLMFRAKKMEMMAPYRTIIYRELLITLLLLLIIIPLVRHLSGYFLRPINRLLQENEKIARRAFDQITPIDSGIQELDQLSQSLVEMAGSIQAYEKQQEVLLEGLIHLIANTIDAKSPYTGEHCKRVPILAKMLILEADKSDEGALTDFAIESEEILKGIEWSAWLHDAGKLVIPDYVIDKATKLETVYNRIHEIRTRFEVLLRDARIRALEAILAGEDPQQAEATYAQTYVSLQRDFAFVAEINLGERLLDDADCARLDRLAETTWLRHFPKHLGLSQAESDRLPPKEDLPTPEHLILQGSEYEIPRDPKDLELFAREKVQMEIPPLLYNRGELYNLCIPQGTLTTEERFKIQEHAIHTLTILKELPWTPHLKQVVEDAANHHEHLDGTGYPRALEARALSVPARVMAIADIFEALTAADRPYKRPKTLSQTLNIMAQMARENKIDPTLFSLFVSQKIYRDYAQAHLQPEQLDFEEIDEGRLVSGLLAG